MRNLLLVISLTIFSMSYATKAKSQDIDGYEKMSVIVSNLSSDKDLVVIENSLFDQPGILDVSYKGRKNDTVELTVKYYKATVDKEMVIKYIEQIPSTATVSGEAYKVPRDSEQKGQKNSVTTLMLRL